MAGEKKLLNAPPKVLPCTCKHQYQDDHYGKGMRFHNFARKGGSGGYRCTVCSKEKPYV